MRRAEGLERDAQLGVGDIDVGGGAKEFVQERAPLLIAASVVWPEKRQDDQGQGVAAGHRARAHHRSGSRTVNTEPWPSTLSTSIADDVERPHRPVQALEGERPDLLRRGEALGGGGHA